MPVDTKGRSAALVRVDDMAPNRTTSDVIDRQWLRAVALAAALIVGACGSTAPQGAPHADRSLGESAVEPRSADGNTLGGEVSGDAASGASGGVSRADGTDAEGGSTARPANAAAVAAQQGSRQGAPPVGPGVAGVSDTTIKIGIATVDPAALAGAAGALTGGAYEGRQTSDETQYQLAIDYINKRGGVAGRKLEPVFHRQDVGQNLSASSRQREQQRACAHFTEDEPVFAMTGRQYMNEDLWLDCAARAKAPFIASIPGYHAYPTEERFESMSDYWYTPISIRAVRKERAMVRFLLDHGSLDSDATVGVMIHNTPGSREGVERGLKPALKAAGITPAVEIVYPDWIESPWSTYVLQLQSAGVTHVIFSTANTLWLPPFFMMRAAEDQRYRPKWALASDHYPVTLPPLGVSEAQLANTSGMGWSPWHDVGDDTNQSEAAQWCEEARAEGGNPEGVAYDFWLPCEQLFFLWAAMRHAPEVSAAGMAAGVAVLNDTHPAVMMIGGATQFGPGRHDGATVARYFVYKRGCEASPNCFAYAGEPTPLAAE